MLGQLEAWWGIGSSHRQGPLWAQSVLYAVTAVLLAFRRVRPLGCLSAMVVVSVVEFAAVGSPEGFAVSVARRTVELAPQAGRDAAHKSHSPTKLLIEQSRALAHILTLRKMCLGSCVHGGVACVSKMLDLIIIAIGDCWPMPSTNRSGWN